jgi:phytanoyl-CoA hydroxylase
LKNIISQQQVSHFLNEGFILVRDFFEKNEIDNLRKEAKKIFALQIKKIMNVEVDINDDSNFEKSMYKFFEVDVDTFMSCGKQVQQLILLHKMGTDSKITSVLQNLGLQFPAISVRPSMLFNSRYLAKKEEYWKLGAHQDWRSSQGSLDSITVWFSLINSNAAIGALQVIPGTHKLGLLDSEPVSYYGKIIGDFKDEDYLQLEFEIGDILFFSSFLVHRSGTNITESIRWSVQLRYNNIAEPTFIERGFPNPFIYKPQPDLVTHGFPEKEQVLRIFTSK